MSFQKFLSEHVLLSEVAPVIAARALTPVARHVAPPLVSAAQKRFREQMEQRKREQQNKFSDMHRQHDNNGNNSGTNITNNTQNNTQHNNQHNSSNTGNTYNINHYHQGQQQNQSADPNAANGNNSNEDENKKNGGFLHRVKETYKGAKQVKDGFKKMSNASGATDLAKGTVNAAKNASKFAVKTLKDQLS